MIAIAGGGALALMLDLLAAAAIVVPLIAGGMFSLDIIGLKGLALRWHILLGAGLGLGTGSLIVLAAGVIAHLSRLGFMGLLIAGTVAIPLGWRGWVSYPPAGAVAIDTALRRRRQGIEGWLPLLIAPFLSLAILATAAPPGMSWSEEGFGYDILEYHLQAPKEYLQSGTISYLPHNVYANFPANVEMLYLLAMVVHGGVYEIGPVANCIHLFLGILVVFSAWALARDWGAMPAAVAAVVLGSSGWLVYLSGLAYVEHGVLFFGLAATAAALQLYRIGPGDAVHTPEHLAGREYARWAMAAGALAGFACGCKYTAVPFIALPLVMVVAAAPGFSVRRRVAFLALFALSTTATFSPWLIKNAVFTGNPVFPLANDLFDAMPPGWSAESQAAWDAGHASPPAESFRARFAAIWQRLPGDRYGRFSWAAMILGVIALQSRRAGRLEFALGLMFFLQLVIWLLFTHGYARFAVPMLIPLALLTGRAFVHLSRPVSRKLCVATLVAAAAFHLAAIGRLFAKEWPGVVPASVLYDGQIPVTECLGHVNNELAADAHVALLGEGRAFYFQRNVSYWVTFNENPVYRQLLSREPQAFAEWLREQGYTHLYVDWSEVTRLDRTYGSVPKITPQELRDPLRTLHERGVRLIHLCTDTSRGRVELSSIFEIQPRG